MHKQIHIVIALFPGVTQLDFSGPHQFFSRLPSAQVSVASPKGEPIRADGLCFSELQSLNEIEGCDVLCVPGGYGVSDMIHECEFMASIRRLGNAASIVCSICTGSIILAAAGLLENRRAACHWAWRELLALFPNVTVVEERVVQDGKVITGGGVTAGIDMALAVIAKVAGEDSAQAIQLGLEYAPMPPFDSGRPELATPELVERLRHIVNGDGAREQQIRKFLACH